MGNEEMKKKKRQRFLRLFSNCGYKTESAFFYGSDCNHPKVDYNKYADNSLEVLCCKKHCPIIEMQEGGVN